MVQSGPIDSRSGELFTEEIAQYIKEEYAQRHLLRGWGSKEKTIPNSIAHSTAAFFSLHLGRFRAMRIRTQSASARARAPRAVAHTVPHLCVKVATK